MFCFRKTTRRNGNQIKVVVGFSLIELMIALAIVGILSMLCLPLYSQHITHARRLEAEINLVKLANALEHYFLIHQTYQNATLSNLGFPEKIVHEQYQLVITEATDSTYAIHADPLDKQAQQDGLCASLLMDSQGKREITGAGKLNECWV